ncbi:MAG: hypothetical protein LRY27_00200 [Chitinophagales bacterium]|nr:hypothetical protein [Chitinophagales bacterium]
MLLFLALFVVALLPILNLYCSTLQPNENDRYGYFSSIFIYAFIVYFSFKVLNKYAPLFIVIFLSVNLYFLKGNLYSNEVMGNVSRNLLDNFEWQDKDKIYILVQPDNCNGVRSFTTLVDQGSEYAYSLLIEKGIDIKSKVDLVYEMNICYPTDSLIVSEVNDSTLNVKLGQWGNWFWKYHLGAVNIETENYKTSVNGIEYTITFKQKLKENEAILYYSKGEWNEFKF